MQAGYNPPPYPPPPHYPPPPPQAPPPYWYPYYPPAPGPFQGTEIKRIGAFIIDYIIVYVIAQLFGLVIQLYLFNSLTTNPFLMFDLFWKLIIISLLLNLTLYTTYFTLQEVLYHQTLGKRVLGLIVVKEDQSQITKREALVRNLARIPYFLPFIGMLIMVLDLILVLIDDRHQRFGDRLAHTLVVNADALGAPQGGYSGAAPGYPTSPPPPGQPPWPSGPPPYSSTPQGYGPWGGGYQSPPQAPGYYPSSVYHQHPVSSSQASQRRSTPGPLPTTPPGLEIDSPEPPFLTPEEEDLKLLRDDQEEG